MLIQSSSSFDPESVGPRGCVEKEGQPPGVVPTEQRCSWRTFVFWAFLSTFIFLSQVLAWYLLWENWYTAFLSLEENDHICSKTPTKVPLEVLWIEVTLGIEFQRTPCFPQHQFFIATGTILFGGEFSLLGTEGHFLHFYFFWESFPLTSFQG